MRTGCAWRVGWRCMGGAWEARERCMGRVYGRCVGGAWEVRGQCHGVLGRLVATEGMGGSADRACGLGCMLGACPLRSGTRGVGCIWEGGVLEVMQGCTL